MTDPNLSQFKSMRLDGATVLLVEDCPDQSRLFAELLMAAGAEVILECNGRSAVGAVRKSGDGIDAIVMDLQMPEMDGLSATREMRQLGFQGAIIAATAYGCDELSESWRQAGCNDYLRKPFPNTMLVETVCRHTRDLPRAERRSRPHREPQALAR